MIASFVMIPTFCLGSILPSSYFDGLSSLWGGCAYVGSAVVAIGLAMHVVQGRPDAGAFAWLLAKVMLIAIATLFIREWLLRLNDIVISFGSMMGANPREVDERFIEFIAGKPASSADTSAWDVIWGTKSLGTAVSYSLLWLFGWLSWGVQYVVKLIGGVLLTAGWALSPLFLSFFMLRPMAGVAQRYLIGLIALVFWPFGWVLAAVVTNAMLEAAAAVSLVPMVVGMGAVGTPALTVLLVGIWMIVSSILAPWITTKVFLMGANPASAMATSVGGVIQSAFAGGMGAGVAMGTAGVGAGAVVAASALGALTSGTESAARGGGSARMTGTAIGGLSGLYAGRFMRRNVAATEASAAAQERQADASEQFSSQFSRHAERARNQAEMQPHTADPNQAAIDIEAHDKRTS